MKPKASVQKVYKASSGKASLSKGSSAIVAGWGVIINNKINTCKGSQEVYDLQHIAQAVANYHNTPGTYFIS